MGAPPNSIRNRVRETLAELGFPAGGGPILVALSGGPDSMGLLHVLRDLGYDLVAAHLDHGTRGEESATDAAFVREQCEAWGVPCVLDRQDIAGAAEGRGKSFEMAAREARYEFLFRAAVEKGACAIATGHQLEDQAETVLLRILRGTSLRGLGGIPVLREDGPLPVIRPLLDIPKTEILDYLGENRIQFREDSSNISTDYMRNKLRLELLPLLASEYNPQITDALVRLADHVHADNVLLEELTEDFIRSCRDEHGLLRRETFATGLPALQRRALLHLAWEQGADPTRDRIVGALAFIRNGASGKLFDLGDGVLLRNGPTTTEFIVEAAKQKETAHSLAIPGETQMFQMVFHARLLDAIPASDLKSYCTPTRQVFDADALGKTVVVRTRRPGDRFQPLGMSGTRKIKDYLSDLQLPMSERDQQLLLVADGKIAWVVSRAVAAFAAVRPETQRFLEIEVDSPVSM